MVRSHREVLDECTGLSRLGWSAAGWLYSTASSSHAVRAAYERLRSGSDYAKPSFSRRLLGRQLVKKFGSSNTPLVVSHPALIGILTGRENLIYQHGELVAPDESFVPGASLVFVPTTEVADRFLGAGYSSGQVSVTGLCIEPELVGSAKDNFSRRQNRLNSPGELCGGFFSSGAEPKEHIGYLAASALSVVRNGGRAVIVARQSGKLAALVHGLFQKSDACCVEVSTETDIPRELPPATLLKYRTRRELDTLTSLVFSHLDYFVSPAHERVNWAAGLGLPMVALLPTTGPYAPLNLELVCRAGVAVSSVELGPPNTFHWNVSRLHSDGKLATMSQAGWNSHPIAGFDTIATELISRFKST